MQRHLTALLLALAGGASLAATAAPPARIALPRDIGVDFPQYADAQALKTACDQGLAATQRELARVEKRPADKGWLAAYDAFTAAMEDRANPITFVSAVHPDKSVREASEACELRWNDFFSTLGQNEKLYRAVLSLKGADETDRQLLKKLREDFEDAGVGLPPEQRQRAKALNDKIAELGQAFDRNIRDANVKLPFTEAELAGVPEGVWKKAPRDEQGRVLLGLSYPEYLPVMQTADNGATRERMWRAKQNEGGEANLKLLDEIVKLRKEYAGLFGAGSWDEFVIRRRMAETPQRVQAFLAEVKGAVEARERSEVEELRRAKAEQLGVAMEATRFERWDLSYYTERLRKAKYSVDQEAFRQYFPPQESLQFTLRLIEKLMGVRYQRVEGAKAWHPEVQTYAVSDAASSKPLGLLRVDLYPREGKYNHAAVWPIRGASTQLHRSTQAHLVVNFNRKGLTLDELETLLHELGHSVHTNLSATRWVQQAGTSVQRDFVEAPSQMLEDWVFDQRTHKLFTEVCPSCTPVPEALDRKSTRLNSSHRLTSRMPSSA
jgi:thimet oligopeptidase